MRISVKGRNVTVGDELRERVDKKFAKVARQVSSLADMEVELIAERNPAIRESQVAEVTLHLKGVTLRAREASDDMVHSINLAAEDLFAPPPLATGGAWGLARGAAQRYGADVGPSGLHGLRAPVGSGRHPPARRP